MQVHELKILVVEDHEPDALLVERRLKGCKRILPSVDVANWLNTAVLALQNRSYDLVLLDLSLPDSHGIDTVYGVRKADPNVPILIMSAHEDIELAVKAIKAGAQGYLLKEIDLTSNKLEREILYTMERFRNELMSKDLLRASLHSVMTGEGQAPAGVLLINEHLNRMEAAYEEVRDFLAHNSAAISSEVREINEKYGLPGIFREAKSILHLDPDSKQKVTRRSDRHLRILREGAQLPSTPEDAEHILLNIIAGEDSDG